MQHIFVHEAEWTYPDRLDYATGASSAALFCARNSRASSQLVLSGVPADAKISAPAEFCGFALEWFELLPVYVEANEPLPADRSLITRTAPYYLYDCAARLGDTLRPADGTAALYFCIRVPASATPGDYSGALRLDIAGETLSLPVSLKVYAATLPEEEHLKIILGYSAGATAQFHSASGERLEQLNREYLTYLRRMRQNMLYVGGVSVEQRDGHYICDFTPLEKSVEQYLSLGFKYFNMSSIGGRKSWHESTILVHGFPAMSYEAYCWLADYLPQLSAFLEKKGWLDRFFMGVSDEPNDANATEFRALCGLCRKFAPRIRLIDALSYTAVHGALDVWVPLNSEYEKHEKEFESFRTGTDEIWQYVCCGPRGENYINRFMDYPLLSTRYQFWGNYRYNMGGYLHWASNCYQPGQDPYLQNCPTHHNADAVCTLPPGDTHILYPGEEGARISMRLEAQRCGIEDFELLRLLAQRDKAKADALCARCFRRFNDVEYGFAEFDAARRELLEALD